MPFPPEPVSPVLPALAPLRVDLPCQARIVASSLESLSRDVLVSWTDRLISITLIGRYT